VCECGGWTSRSIDFIPEVHGCDNTAVHSKYVENFAVRKNIALKAPDELVHRDADLAIVSFSDCPRFV
jgi:hypothetical protein